MEDAAGRLLCALLCAATGCAAGPAPVGGAIYHYLRSNRDGSDPEHVVQFRPVRTRIAVYKWVQRCTTAAYVTAETDAAVREVRVYHAGKVRRDGGQERFGSLTLDPATSRLQVELDPPDGGAHLSVGFALRRRPYILFDFDLADLNAFLQGAHPTHPTGALTLALPVVWPGAGQGLLRDLGSLVARPAGEEVRLGRQTRRFNLTVQGPAPGSGALWLDAARGFIVEAELSIPNHAEYRDFRLRLEWIQPGGARAWAALLRGHYAGCPPP